MPEDCTNDRLEALRHELQSVKDNHLPHLQEEVTGLKIMLVQHSTDLQWLKKSYWMVAAASVGALLAGVANLILGRH